MPNYDSSNKMKGMPMNKNHGMPMHSGAPHMESAKQERKNLMDDNPVARTAAGDRPWIAKHYKSNINYGTPMNSGHTSPMEAHDGKKFGDDKFFDSHFKSGKPRDAAPKKTEDMRPKMDHK